MTLSLGVGIPLLLALIAAFFAVYDRGFTEGFRKGSGLSQRLTELERSIEEKSAPHD